MSNSLSLSYDPFGPRTSFRGGKSILQGIHHSHFISQADFNKCFTEVKGYFSLTQDGRQYILKKDSLSHIYSTRGIGGLRELDAIRYKQSVPALVYGEFSDKDFTLMKDNILDLVNKSSSGIPETKDMELFFSFLNNKQKTNLISELMGGDGMQQLDYKNDGAKIQAIRVLLETDSIRNVPEIKELSQIYINRITQLNQEYIDAGEDPRHLQKFCLLPEMQIYVERFLRSAHMDFLWSTRQGQDQQVEELKVQLVAV